jgi:glycosyltransferase involved in cell wall biosynthesis
MEVSRNFMKFGNQVKLIVPRYAQYHHQTPVDIIFVPIIKVRFLRTLIYELIAPLYMFFYLALWRPDIVYWRQAYLTIFPVLLAKIFKKMVITEVNGLTIDEVDSEPLSSLRKKIILKFEKYNYEGSNHLICVAPIIKKRILKQYNLAPDKVSVILNGVNSDRMPLLDTSEAKKKIGLDPETAVVGFVGHFFPWDGIEYLIDAAEEIVEEKTNVRFLIIGHGRWGTHLKPLVEQKGLKKYFTFTGKVPWEDLYLYVNAFDVATAPYSMEINAQSGRSSLKILEYFACKKPVVASKTEAIPEVADLEKKGLGITVPAENSSALAEAILKLLKNKRLMQRMGDGGRNYVVSERSWAIAAGKILSTIKSVMN